MANTVEGISSTDIQSGLAELREEGLLCDIQLEAQGRKIFAHRNILASVSPYFRVLFAGSFREANESVIELEGIEFESLKTIVDSVYTSELKLTTDNVCDVLTATHIFQMDKLIASCEQFMLSNLSRETSLSYLQAAETYSSKKLVSKINDYILENFAELRETEDFLKISKDALIYYLSNNKLNTGFDESLVFNTAKQWLEFEQDRMVHATEILTNVRFNAIKLSNLTEISDIPTVEGNEELKTLVKNAFAFHGKQFQKPLHRTQVKPRGEEGIFLVQNLDDQGDIELWENTSGTAVRFISLQHRNKYETFTSPATYANGSLSAVQMNNFLFLFGVKNESFEPISYRFDATTNEWLQLAPIPQQATVVSSVTRLNSYIYFLGGIFVEKDSRIGDDPQLSTNAFVYVIASNHWRQLPDVAPVFYEGAATSCKANDHVYVSGGYSQDNFVLSKFTAFDTRTKLWLEKPRLRHPRTAHVMESVGDTGIHIYVIGGSGFEGEPVREMEVFNILTQQWTDVQRHTLATFNTFALVKDFDIFLVGGGLSERSETVITVYDTNDYNFDDYGYNYEPRILSEHRVRLPFPASYHVCGLLTMQVKRSLPPSRLGFVS